MKHGFIKVAAATPVVQVADPVSNAATCIALAAEAAEQGVKLILFPELCLTGATCGDLFMHEYLLTGAMDALLAYAEATSAYDLVSIVGLPVSYADRIYDCAAVVAAGQVLGFVPKIHLSAEERRTFTPAPRENLTYDALPDGSFATFGVNQTFVASNLPALRIGVELGIDAAASVPPSARLASAGATVICHPTTTPETIGASDYRRLIVTARSATSVCGYLSANSGSGESTTDHAYGGHALVAECGHILAERFAFTAGKNLTVTELDLAHITHDRRTGDFDTAAHGEVTENYFALISEDTTLTRTINPHPFLPDDPVERARRCEDILGIQVHGLATRVAPAWVKKIVLGISGGLDSTLALLVMTRAMDALGRPRKDIVAVTMPCFGTTQRTKTNATILCEELGVELRTVDIFAAVEQHFSDIGHDPFLRNVVYENAQARERTQVLMDIANEVGGMVIGTGDLSELALGWATYNGDHMSMYGVNAGIPKTLVRHMVGYIAASERAAGHTALAEALDDIIHTPVSPELLPADDNGDIAQKTEDLVGPYELHDFYLYHFFRYASTPDKLFRLARTAFDGVYDDSTLIHWLETFIRRFFNQQFKRSCLPDGPAVGSVGLSPRGGWRMPSDASAALWMREIQSLKEQYL